MYHAGAVALVHDLLRNRQQHYTAHDDDITALAVCLKPRMVATGQCGKVARIQIWNIDSCATASTIANPAIQRRISALSWSRTGSHLVAVGGDDNRTAFIFCFLRRGSAAQIYKENLVGTASAGKGSVEDPSRQHTPLFHAPALLFSVAMQVPFFACYCLTSFVVTSRPQPADVFAVQFNGFSGSDGAGEFWAVGDKMVKSCDIMARSCSKGIFGGNGVLQSALCVTFSSSPAFVITGMADGDIYFWSAGSVITRNNGAHPGGVTCVAWFTQFTDNGPCSRLASGGKDEYLRIWDMSDRVSSLTATLHSTSPQPFPLISRFLISPILPRSLGPRASIVSLDHRQEQGRLVVGTSKNALFVVDLSAFVPAASPPAADAPAARRALSTESARILLSGNGGEIGALAMVTWKGQQCAVTGSTDGSVTLTLAAQLFCPATTSAC